MAAPSRATYLARRPPCLVPRSAGPLWPASAAAFTAAPRPIKAGLNHFASYSYSQPSTLPGFAEWEGAAATRCRLPGHLIYWSEIVPAFN
jgi:hypothetical protein